MKRFCAGSSGRSPSDRPAGSAKRISAGRRSRPPSSSGAPEGDDLAGAHDRDAVGEVLRLVHVMGGQEDRLAELAQRADRRPRLAARRGVKAGGRLVEEDQVGIADERESEIEPPALTAGELLGAHVALLGCSSTSSMTSSTGAAARVVAAVHLDQLGDRQIPLDAALLQHDPDPLAQLALAAGRIHAEHARLARAPRAVALEDLDRRRLARAVGAEQAEHLAPARPRS